MKARGIFYGDRVVDRYCAAFLASPFGRAKASSVTAPSKRRVTLSGALAESKNLRTEGLQCRNDHAKILRLRTPCFAQDDRGRTRHWRTPMVAPTSASLASPFGRGARAEQGWRGHFPSQSRWSRDSSPRGRAKASSVTAPSKDGCRGGVSPPAGRETRPLRCTIEKACHSERRHSRSRRIYAPKDYSAETITRRSFDYALRASLRMTETLGNW